MSQHKRRTTSKANRIPTGQSELEPDDDVLMQLGVLSLTKWQAEGSPLRRPFRNLVKLIFLLGNCHPVVGEIKEPGVFLESDELEFLSSLWGILLSYENYINC